MTKAAQFTAGVVDTGDKLTAGAVNARQKFIAGVTEINVNLRKDSCGKLPLTTLVVNLPPVLLTPGVHLEF